MEIEKTPLEKIAFTLLVKYSEPPEVVQRCIASVSPFVDKIFVTITKDTPTSDTSKIDEICKTFNAEISYFDWIDDFAAARNFLLERVPKDEYGWFYWQDCDDVLKGGENIQEIIHQAILNKWGSIFFSYWYSVDLNEKGEVKEIVIEHKRERLVRNDGSFKWIGRIHETLIEQRPVSKILKNECVVVHLTDESRLTANLDRNIRILESALKQEDRKDPRTVMYLAKAYFDRGKFQPKVEDKKIDFDLARNLFLEYLEGAGQPGTPGYRESSGWDEERSSAWAYLGDIYRLGGQYNQSIKCTLNALVEAPQFPNYYLDIAMTYVLQGKWDKADRWFKLGLGTPIPQTTLITNPRDLKARALEIDWHVAIAKQDIERAYKAAEGLSQIFPKFEAVQERLKVTGQLRETNHAAQSLAYLTRYLENSGEQSKIPELVKSIPSALEQESFVSEMKHKYLPPRLWGEKEIAILCGPGFEKWSPKNVANGIGGSEEAVIYLSKELARLGYSVTVFADPREDQGDHEGVTYRPWHEVNQRDSFNILILWRSVGFVDLGFTARQTYLWLHDVPANPEFTEERVKKIDKIFVLSEYHRSLLRMSLNGQIVPMPEEKIVVTANGILPVNINKKWKRKPHNLIWTSSYDRGLPYLLLMWEDIRKEVPDATLDIYYGWNLYDTIHKDNPARLQWKNKVELLMHQPGITHHGRVGHSELHKAFATSGVWSYPTDFTEISCISAMKAQAHGAFPVVTNFAALKETVKYGVKVDADLSTEEGIKTYKEALVKFLKEESGNEEKRKVMMDDSQKIFLWSEVANKWKELFDSKK